MLHVKTIRVSLTETSSASTSSAFSLPVANQFAILDACDEPQILTMVNRLGSRSISLYAGKSAERFQDIAPYLVEVDHDLLKWIHVNLSGKPWGLFLRSTASLVEIRKHLRQFLMVELEDRSVYFRFYDPRVLPAFLQSTGDADLQAFFGPIEKFVVPSNDAQQFVELSYQTRSATVTS